MCRCRSILLGVLHAKWTTLTVVLVVLFVTGCQAAGLAPLHLEAGVHGQGTTVPLSETDSSPMLLSSGGVVLRAPNCDQPNPPPICDCEGVQPPTAPTVGVTAATESTITISWVDRSSGELAFWIERRPENTPRYTEVYRIPSSSSDTTGDTYSWTDQDLWPPGDKYIYRVYVGAECANDYAAVTTGTLLPDPPAPPANFTSTSEKTSITLSYQDASTNELGFSLWRCVVAGGCQKIEEQASTPARSVETGATYTRIDNRLQPDTEYCYQVFAWNNGGYNNAELCTRTNPLELPAAPSDLHVTSTSENSLTFEWLDNADNESGFLFEWRVRGVGPSGTERITIPNEESYTLTGLQAGASYCATVRAYNQDGESPESNEICENTDQPTSPPPPQGIRELQLFNCSDRTVHVWVLSSSTPQAWTQEGSLPSQRPTQGDCPAAGASPISISFSDNATYQVVAVDPTLIACSGRNDPTYGACRRAEYTIVGSAQGSRLQCRVDLNCFPLP